MRLPASLVALVVALLLKPLGASAQIIYGCIKSNGALKVVTSPTNCAAKETRISWSQVGPQGPPGAEGPPGPEGRPGPTLSLFDSSGHEIGLLVGPLAFEPGNVAPGSYEVYLPSSGLTIAIDSFGRIDPYPRATVFYFEQQDCQGQAYLWNEKLIGSRVYCLEGGSETCGNRFFVTNRSEAANVYVLSSASPNCNNLGRIVERAIPADEISLGDLGLTFPLPTPLYIATGSGQ